MTGRITGRPASTVAKWRIAIKWLSNASLLVLLLLGYVVIPLILIRNVIVLGPQSARAQRQLEEELTLIDPLPSSRLVSRQATHSVGKAFVELELVDSKQRDTIVGYYDFQLVSHGWRSVETHETRRRYCKAGMSAALTFSEGDDRPYDLSMSWGVERCP